MLYTQEITPSFHYNDAVLRADGVYRHGTPARSSAILACVQRGFYVARTCFQRETHVPHTRFQHRSNARRMRRLHAPPTRVTCTLRTPIQRKAPAHRTRKSSARHRVHTTAPHFGKSNGDFVTMRCRCWGRFVKRLLLGYPWRQGTSRRITASPKPHAP